jgi:L-ascorbate metabolism protein UlaG (beta-lactamase superfamily)
MKITHIYHSGFCVEMERTVLIFDWYRGALPPLSKDRPVCCFVSHGHGDHYGSCIWSLRDEFPDVTYILDRNIRVPGAGLSRHPKLPRANIRKVRPHEVINAGELRIETLLSTDQGVAYVVDTEGARIFHAGDLNIWHWQDESERANRWQADTYRAELKRIAGHHVDAALIPIDPRLGAHAADGPAMFMEMIQPDYAFAMHYWDQAAESKKVLADPKLAPFSDRIHYEEVLEI